MTFTMKRSAVALIALAVVGASVLPASAATKATPKATAKPSITGAPRAGGFGDGANAQAFAKYTACLAKAGIKLPSFGGGRGFGAPGTRPTGVRPTGAPAGGAPGPHPSFSLSPAQQKAFTACAALRPSFGGNGGVRPDGRGGGIAPGGVAPGTTNLGGGTTAPKTGTSPAYFACLKSHGLPVTTAAQVAGLDNQNPKVLAALKACAGK